MDLLRAEARERDGQLVIQPLDDGGVAAILREQLIDRPIDSRVTGTTRREAMENACDVTVVVPRAVETRLDRGLRVSIKPRVLVHPPYR